MAKTISKIYLVLSNIFLGAWSIFFGLVLIMTLFHQFNTQDLLLSSSLLRGTLAGLLLNWITWKEVNKERKKIILTNLLGKVLLFNLTFGIVSLPGMFDEPIAAAFFIVVASIFLGLNLALNLYKKKEKVFVKPSYLPFYAGYGCWEEAYSEYMLLHDKTYEEIDESDEEEISKYANMPFLYLLVWLQENHYLSLDIEGNVIDVFRQMHYVVEERHIKDTIYPFVHDYYADHYMQDYLSVIQNAGGTSYCKEFSQETYIQIAKLIDKRYLEYYDVLKEQEFNG